MARNSLGGSHPSPINIALFDSSTLLGKGVKTHLRRLRFPVGQVRVFDTGAVEQGGNLTEFDGEAMLAVQPDLAELERVDLAFFCGPSGTGESYLDWPERGRFVAIDLTQAANSREGIPVVNAAVNPEASRPRSGILASPHPVSQFLSTFLAPLAQGFGIEEVVSLVMQPASEAGEEGIEELYRQTVSVLNFTEVPKERFGRVLAFNLLPASLAPGNRKGEDSIAREVASILNGRPFVHTVRILLVPVFHCHSFLCRVRFREEVNPGRIREALAARAGLRFVANSGAITPAELSGEEGILLGELTADPSLPSGLWFWGVTDNLSTGVALNAVRMAEELVRSGALKGRDTP